MRRVGLWLGLVLVVPALNGATDPSGPGAADGNVPASCTITVKARLDPGALGQDGVSLYMNWGLQKNSSKVRIKSGTWSTLGNTGDPRLVNFKGDGTWKEFNSRREGAGEWSGRVHLNMGCRYNRRYEFRVNRNGSSTAEVRPQYPSTSSWTTSQTINLGNLARYF